MTMGDDEFAKVVANALLEVPGLISSPIPPLDELMGSSPSECVQELYRSLSDTHVAEYEARVILRMPEPLLVDLTRRAQLSGVAPEDLMIGLLARAAMSTSPRVDKPPVPRFARNPTAYELDDPWGEDEQIYDGLDRPLRAL
jgi:hypothetical protein